ncbi:MAG: Rrf2 family transcriptional regulator [Nitrospinota bacterium]
MRITAKGHYAVMAMLDLSKQLPNTAVPLSNISVRQGIPLPFLEQLFGRLRKGNLVSSVRGPGGGYKLAKPTKDITIGSILKTVGEDFSMAACVNDDDSPAGNKCKKISECSVNLLWKRISRHVSDLTESINLKDLLEEDQKYLQKKVMDHKYQFTI